MSKDKSKTDNNKKIPDHKHAEGKEHKLPSQGSGNGDTNNIVESHEPFTEIISASRHYSGPLPLPEHIEEYERILPGSADRIMSMAEKQQQNSWEIAKTEIEYENKYRKLGLIFGFITLMFLVFAALFCAYIGQTWVAIAFLTATVIGVVGRFIDGRRKSVDKIEESKSDLED